MQNVLIFYVIEKAASQQETINIYDLGSQKSHTVLTILGTVSLTPVLFKGQLYFLSKLT